MSKEDEVPVDPVPSGDPPAAPEKKDKVAEDALPPAELSEEDQALKERLDVAVQRLQEGNDALYQQALMLLADEIKTATSSMTSVPKPLKYLAPHFQSLKEVYADLPPSPNRALLADVLSVLAMTFSADGSRESLTFKLQGNRGSLTEWGHEFLRSLAGEIAEEYNARVVEVSTAAAAGATPEVSDLMELVDVIVPHHLRHNAEAEAVDLLMEVQQLPKLRNAAGVDEKNYARVCLYLLRCADFMPDPDDHTEVLETAHALFMEQGQHVDALRVALRLDDSELATALVRASNEAVDASERAQMAILVGRHAGSAAAAAVEVMEADGDEKVTELAANVSRAEHLKYVARELDLTEPKTPEDIYKRHLADTGARLRRANADGAAVDSARENLASTYVNAFVNAGFGSDRLMTGEQGNTWVYKQKTEGMLAAAASLGMVLMWDVDEGLNSIDKFFSNSDDHIRAGACLATGLNSCGVRHESDPAYALLTDVVSDRSSQVRRAAIMGLAVAYAGTAREDLHELLGPVVDGEVGDGDVTEAALASLALGQVFVGTCNGEVGARILERMAQCSDADLDNTVARFMCLGLGLLFLGKNEKVDAMLEALGTIVEHRIVEYAKLTLETCAYAGTGNVLKVQRMLHVCAEHLTENADHQAIAVLGIALISVGEDISKEMTMRAFEHILHYGELPIKRVVPLAVALLHVSTPDYAVVDQLSRLTHDADADVAMGAILGLGLVSAGTNNSRVAGLLRSLSDFYAKEASHLFVVRVAQGLNAMGKGLLTLSPFHSDRFLLDARAMTGLLAVLHGALDIQHLLLDRLHYLLFSLATAMSPRYLVMVDEDMQHVEVSVRVGQAVETVGQAGRPKTISGFQEHTTPVLLGAKDRAEMATEQFVPVSNVLEGVVIVRAAPTDGAAEMET